MNNINYKNSLIVLAVVALSILIVGKNALALSGLNGVALDAERQRIQHYLAERYASVSVTHQFMDENKEVSCIDRQTQPSALKLQLTELASPPIERVIDNKKVKNEFKTGPFWDKEHYDTQGRLMQCPKGSVVTRFTDEQDILRLGGLDAYLSSQSSKGKYPASKSMSISGTTGSLYDGSAGYTSFYSTKPATSLQGVYATLNTWQPYVYNGEDCWLFWCDLYGHVSRSTITISGTYNGYESSLVGLSAGWAVDPYRFQDTKVHFYMSMSGYLDCTNDGCEDFVFYDEGFDVNKTLTASVMGGDQYAITVKWFHDANNPSHDSDWWLMVNDKWVGYFPARIFWNAAQGVPGGLYYDGDTLSAGGQVICDGSTVECLASDMGSGAFPESGFHYAAYQRAWQYYDATGIMKNVVSASASNTNANCYKTGALSVTTSSWGTYFYFGGSGYGTTCQ